MCIAYINFEPNHKYKLLIAMNRDEFYDRPFDLTKDYEGLYYPKDLKSNGTWFTFNKKAEFALLTNIRRYKQPTPNKSRGEIPIQALHNNLKPNPSDYRLFNLVKGTAKEAFHQSSYKGLSRIDQKSFTICNSQAFPSTWSKEENFKKQLDQLVSDELCIDDFFKHMISEQPHPVQSSDSTGYPEEIEHKLTPFFVKIPEMNYGTVHQLLFLVTAKDEVLYFERSTQNGIVQNITELRFTP